MQLKRIGSMIGCLVVAFLLSGCFGGKSITFTERVLTADEQKLVYSAGGLEALHFTVQESLPAGHAIQFSIEQFESGQLVGTLGEMTWKDSTEEEPLFGFGLQPADEGVQDHVLFSGLNERMQPELEAMPGGSALLPAFEEELTLKQGESAYLAYYIVSQSGRVEPLRVQGPDAIEQLQAYDRCLLLKVKWAE